jgi:hypothetical protein
MPQNTNKSSKGGSKPNKSTGNVDQVTGPPKNGASSKAGGVHQEHEDHPWTINVGDHEQRTDSPAYKLARKLMIKIVQELQPWFYGKPPYQDHHGGGLWVKDEQGWLLIKNLAGMEWSSQFCAEPAKVDILRQNAKRLYAKFPLSAPAFKEMGFDLDKLLNSPITDANGVAAWTDSICNASLPLTAPGHTGVLPKGGGVHHYPTPITDIDLFKHDDFQLWVTDSQGQPAAVVPVGKRGSGDGRVQVVYSTPGTKLSTKHAAASSRGERLILSDKHPLARKAFAKQYQAIKEGTYRKAPKSKPQP